MNRTDRTKPTFESVWTKKMAEGYDYGDDALQNVRFGWDLAVEAYEQWRAACEAYEPHYMMDDPETDRCLRCKRTRAEAPDGCTGYPPTTEDR